MNRIVTVLMAAALLLALARPLHGGVVTSAARETGEFILRKFGKGVAGKTAEEISESAARAVARHGDEALPILRRTGHAGFAALESAGDKAPEVIKLFARRGDEAAWIISEPRKLAIFLRHGDTAADALLRHPGISETLIARFGDEAIGTLNTLSRRGGQRLAMAMDDGLLSATPRSAELLSVIRRYGDEAMDFIWKNKGALTVASLLGSFLANPEAYLSGAKTLIVEPVLSGAKDLVVDPVVAPIVQSTNWTLIIAAALGIAFLPAIAGSFARTRATIADTSERKAPSHGGDERASQDFDA